MAWVQECFIRGPVAGDSAPSIKYPVDSGGLSGMGSEGSRGGRTAIGRQADERYLSLQAVVSLGDYWWHRVASLS